MSRLIRIYLFTFIAISSGVKAGDECAEAIVQIKKRVSFLVHHTPVVNVASLVQSDTMTMNSVGQKMRRGGFGPSVHRSSIFFLASEDSPSGAVSTSVGMDRNNAVLYMSNRLLERRDFFINEGFSRGEYYPYTSPGVAGRSYKPIPAAKYLARTGSRVGEICFGCNIPSASFGLGIWVPEQYRAQVLKEIEIPQEKYSIPIFFESSFPSHDRIQALDTKKIKEPIEPLSHPITVPFDFIENLESLKVFSNQVRSGHYEIFQINMVLSGLHSGELFSLESQSTPFLLAELAENLAHRNIWQSWMVHQALEKNPDQRERLRNAALSYISDPTIRGWGYMADTIEDIEDIAKEEFASLVTAEELLKGNLNFSGFADTK